MTKGLTGIILAGGRSRRMGRDKAHLAWGAVTLLEQVIATLRPVVDELVVAVKDPEAFRHLNVRVVADLVPGQHALGGLYTGLLAASHARCFVCGCDAPFLNPRVIRVLVEQADGWDLVMPRTPAGLQPLHAVYARSLISVVEEQLSSRQRDLQALVPKVRSRIIDHEQLRPFDPGGLSFFNINTPADYDQACAIQRNMAPGIAVMLRTRRGIRRGNFRAPAGLMRVANNASPLV
ncbi:MAG: molybdenum cofactor guanylyltransferase [Candidatus Omnitrophica bacterium]|nr:molybdenum cofactor guanylyltransferase [Candidatus Omnitrophota bacterium]